MERTIKTDNSTDNYSALIHIVFKANSGLCNEVVKMNDSATIDRLLNKLIIDKGWIKNL